VLELEPIAADAAKCGKCGVPLGAAARPSAWLCPACARGYGNASQARARQNAAAAARTGESRHGLAKKLFILLVVALIAYALLHKRAPRHGPGVLVEDEPQQSSISKVLADTDTYTISAMASYSIKARVLGTKTYDSDRAAAVSPIDLALGWQEMSSDALLNTLTISQNGRFYFWHTDLANYPRATIETQSSNHHIIPANRDIKNKIMKIGEGDIVAMQGYLVTVTFKDGKTYPWVSSMTRNDVGAGACEIMYVEDVAVSTPR
jgi:hypothetical protein